MALFKSIDMILDFCIVGFGIKELNGGSKKSATCSIFFKFLHHTLKEMDREKEVH